MSIKIFSDEDLTPSKSSYPKATIRYDQSEVSESEYISILSEMSSGSIEQYDYALKAEVKELYEAMGEDAFVSYLTGKNIDSLVKDSSNKDEIKQIIEDNSFTPEKLKEKIKDQVRDHSYSADLSHIWDDLRNKINQLFSEYESHYWLVSGRNMGWRNQSGSNLKKIRTHDDFFSMLPKTECTFYITKNDDGSLTMINYHHDSPTGEFYEFKNMTPKVVVEIYKDKENEIPLSDLLENSHSSDMQKDKNSVKALFNESMNKNSSDDISELFRNGLGHDSIEEAKKYLIQAMEQEDYGTSAMRAYVMESSFFSGKKGDKALEELKKIAKSKNKLAAWSLFDEAVEGDDQA